MSIRVCAHGKLYLVPVTQRIRGRNDGLDRKIQSSDPGKGFLHESGFCRALRFIGKVAQCASSARTIGGALGQNAVGTAIQDLLDSAESISFQGLDNTDIEFIARGRGGNKNCLALKMSHTVAVAGQGFYGKGNDLIFFQRHDFLLKRLICKQKRPVFSRNNKKRV